MTPEATGATGPPTPQFATAVGVHSDPARPRDEPALVNDDALALRGETVRGEIGRYRSGGASGGNVLDRAGYPTYDPHAPRGQARTRTWRPRLPAAFQTSQP